MLKRSASRGYAECQSEHMFNGLVRICNELLEALCLEQTQASSMKVWQAQPERRTLLQVYDAAQAFYCDIDITDGVDGGSTILDRHWLLHRLVKSSVWKDMAVWSGLLREAMVQEQSDRLQRQNSVAATVVSTDSSTVHDQVDDAPALWRSGSRILERSLSSAQMQLALPHGSMGCKLNFSRVLFVGGAVVGHELQFRLELQKVPSSIGVVVEEARGMPFSKHEAYGLYVRVSAVTQISDGSEMETFHPLQTSWRPSFDEACWLERFNFLPKRGRGMGAPD